MVASAARAAADAYTRLPQPTGSCTAANQEHHAQCEHADALKDAQRAGFQMQDELGVVGVRPTGLRRAANPSRFPCLAVISRGNWRVRRRFAWRRPPARCGECPCREPCRSRTRRCSWRDRRMRSRARTIHMISSARRMVRGSSIMNVMHWRWMDSYSSSTILSSRAVRSAAIGIHAGEGIERIVHHLRDLPAQMLDLAVLVRGPLHGGEARGDVADLLALIADALEVGDGLDDGDDSPADRRPRAPRMARMRLHSSSIDTSMPLTL